MVNKRESSRDVLTYELVLEHSDIVAMMNESPVAMAGGSVAANQPFRLFIRKPNDSEINLALREVRSGDKLVIRFNIVDLDYTDTPYVDLDVT